jgi:hypothetical protein
LPLGCSGDLRVKDWPRSLESSTETSPCDAGRSCNPFLIEHFPYAHAGSTSQVKGEIDAYSCAPDTDESGDDLFYQLTVDEVGVLTVSVEDGSDVDIGLHLLVAGPGADRLRVVGLRKGRRRVRTDLL